MRVRPSTAFYGGLSLDMDRSPGFGSTHTDSGPIKTRFPFGSAPSALNLASMGDSPDRSTKSTRSHLDVVPQFMDTGFQVLFHSPPGVLFTFPSRYLFAIGHCLVFSLSRWSSILPSGFLVSRRTQDSASFLFALSYTGLSPCFASLPRLFY